MFKYFKWRQKWRHDYWTDGGSGRSWWRGSKYNVWRINFKNMYKSPLLRQIEVWQLNVMRHFGWDPETETLDKNWIIVQRATTLVSISVAILTISRDIHRSGSLGEPLPEFVELQHLLWPSRTLPVPFPLHAHIHVLRMRLSPCYLSYFSS